MSGANITTDFLVAQPSVRGGVASIVDIFGNVHHYNDSVTDDDADMKALYSDWAMIGQDMREAFDAYQN